MKWAQFFLLAAWAFGVQAACTYRTDYNILADLGRRLYGSDFCGNCPIGFEYVGSNGICGAYVGNGASVNNFQPALDFCSTLQFCGGVSCGLTGCSLFCELPQGSATLSCRVCSYPPPKTRLTPPHRKLFPLNLRRVWVWHLFFAWPHHVDKTVNLYLRAGPADLRWRRCVSEPNAVARTPVFRFVH